MPHLTLSHSTLVVEKHWLTYMLWSHALSSPVVHGQPGSRPHGEEGLPLHVRYRQRIGSATSVREVRQQCHLWCRPRADGHLSCRLPKRHFWRAGASCYGHVPKWHWTVNHRHLWAGSRGENKIATQSVGVCVIPVLFGAWLLPSLFIAFWMEFLLLPQFLQDLISAVVQILVHRGRLQGWKPERMGDGSLGIKLLAEQMCSELKPSGKKGYSDVYRNRKMDANTHNLTTLLLRAGVLWCLLSGRLDLQGLPGVVVPGDAGGWGPECVPEWPAGPHTATSL